MASNMVNGTVCRPLLSEKRNTCDSRLFGPSQLPPPDTQTPAQPCHWHFLSTPSSHCSLRLSCARQHTPVAVLLSARVHSLLLGMCPCLAYLNSSYVGNLRGCYVLQTGHAYPKSGDSSRGTPELLKPEVPKQNPLRLSSSGK